MKMCRKFFVILAILTIFLTLLNSTVFATNETTTSNDANTTITMSETNEANKAIATIATNENITLNNGNCIKMADGETSSAQDIINAGNSFINQGMSEAGDTDPVSIALKLLPVGSLLVAIGIAVLVIVLAIMAIRWITAKPDQKAKLQQQLIGYVVSCFVIFGAIWIWNFVTGIMLDVENKLADDNKPTTAYIEKA